MNIDEKFIQFYRESVEQTDAVAKIHANNTKIVGAIPINMLVLSAKDFSELSKNAEASSYTKRWLITGMPIIDAEYVKQLGKTHNKPPPMAKIQQQQQQISNAYSVSAMTGNQPAYQPYQGYQGNMPPTYQQYPAYPPTQQQPMQPMQPMYPYYQPQQQPPQQQAMAPPSYPAYQPNTLQAPQQIQMPQQQQQQPQMPQVPQQLQMPQQPQLPQVPQQLQAPPTVPQTNVSTVPTGQTGQTEPPAEYFVNYPYNRLYTKMEDGKTKYGIGMGYLVSPTASNSNKKVPVHHDFLKTIVWDGECISLSIEASEGLNLPIIGGIYKVNNVHMKDSKNKLTPDLTTRQFYMSGGVYSAISRDVIPDAAFSRVRDKYMGRPFLENTMEQMDKNRVVYFNVTNLLPGDLIESKPNSTTKSVQNDSCVNYAPMGHIAKFFQVQKKSQTKMYLYPRLEVTFTQTITDEKDKEKPKTTSLFVTGISFYGTDILSQCLFGINTAQLFSDFFTSYNTFPMEILADYNVNEKETVGNAKNKFAIQLSGLLIRINYFKVFQKIGIQMTKDFMEAFVNANSATSHIVGKNFGVINFACIREKGEPENTWNTGGSPIHNLSTKNGASFLEYAEDKYSFFMVGFGPGCSPTRFEKYTGSTVKGGDFITENCDLKTWGLKSTSAYYACRFMIYAAEKGCIENYKDERKNITTGQMFKKTTEDKYELDVAAIEEYRKKTESTPVASLMPTISAVPVIQAPPVVQTTVQPVVQSVPVVQPPPAIQPPPPVVQIPPVVQPPPAVQPPAMVKSVTEQEQKVPELDPEPDLDVEVEEQPKRKRSEPETAKKKKKK